MATKRIGLLLAITALLIAATAAPALALLTNGQAAPNFQLTDLSGTSHTLSEYRGKVVVIDFFGWGCGYCQSDAKDTLVPLYNNYFKNDPNVQFLGVEVDGGSISQDQGFVQETGASWPILTAGGSVFSAYQAASTPTLYVISPAGTVASSSVYPTDAATLKSTINSLEGSAQSPVNTGPAVASWGSGRLDVFARGTNDGLYQKTYTTTGGWSSWQSLGGTLTSSPAATSRNPGGLTVFVRGPDGGIWYRDYMAGSWGPWAPIGGSVAANTGPAVASWGSGRLDVFVECTNGALYQKTYTTTGGWSGWQYLGGTLTSGPGATSRNPGGLTVFFRGTDGAIWYRDYVAGSWGPWASIGGSVAANTGPAVASWGSGRLDVFVECTNGALYQKTYTTTGGWSGWQYLGGTLTSGPGATSRNPGGLTVFFRGTDGAVYYRDYVGGSWGPLASIGGEIPAGT